MTRVPFSASDTMSAGPAAAPPAACLTLDSRPAAAVYVAQGFILFSVEKQDPRGKGHCGA